MKLKKFVYVADTHGDLVDEDAAEKLFEFTNHFRPHYRIHGGDLRDNACLRSGASEDEQQQPLDADWDKSEWLASNFFGTGCENWFLNGNHDHPRIEKLLETKGMTIRARATRELGENLMDNHKALMKRLRVSELPYDSRKGVLEIGPLRFVHGYHVNEYAAKKHAEVYGCVILGHVHRPQTHNPRSYDGSFGKVAGCLCDLDPPYMMRCTSKLAWKHGWVYGFIDPQGKGPDHFKVFDAEKIGDKWIFPSEMK